MLKKDSNFKVLYPLQMQPEANIDVWGKAYRDQTVLIEKIAKQLPDNCTLYVKPNPKSKYELSTELINLVTKNKIIKHLHHSTKMDDVLVDIDLVITVTGTIAIECVLSNKPVVTMVNTINNKVNNCIFINNINNELEIIINNIISGKFISISNLEKINFINLLNSTSYKGLISDPFSDNNCVLKNNIALITKAFKDVIN